MKFLVVTFAPLLKEGDHYYSYAPYVREMDMWFRYCDEIGFCCPMHYSDNKLLLAPFKKNEFNLFPVTTFTQKSILFKPWLLLAIFISIYKAMRWADHIHLRCPGNMGLLGSIVQVLFPRKKKTTKYAGNWDWNSIQPWSYRLQQRLLRNTFLTRNMQVLVYGEWEDRTRNIKPFFTASYNEKDKLIVSKPAISERINMVFVGTLNVSKRPSIALEVLKELIRIGKSVQLVLCGDGPEKVNLEYYANRHGLDDHVTFRGNIPADKVKEELQKAHFLIFASKSEGWPKAVAEAMWWGCIPITTPVSCVPQMVDFGKRGMLIEPDLHQIVNAVNHLYDNDHTRSDMMHLAMEWSREFTLERFENEIRELLEA